METGAQIRIPSGPGGLRLWCRPSNAIYGGGPTHFAGSYQGALSLSCASNPNDAACRGPKQKSRQSTGKTSSKDRITEVPALTVIGHARANDAACARRDRSADISRQSNPGCCAIPENPPRSGTRAKRPQRRRGPDRSVRPCRRCTRVDGYRDRSRSTIAYEAFRWGCRRARKSYRRGRRRKSATSLVWHQGCGGGLARPCPI